MSAKEKMGIDVLEETLKDLFFEGNLAFNNEIYITNIRHKTALSDAYGALERVRDSIDAGMPEDFYSIPVYHLPHLSSKCVHLSYQMSLRDGNLP